MNKIVLICFMSAVCSIIAMDQPQKSQTGDYLKTNFIELGTNLFNIQEFKELLNKGTYVSPAELEEVVKLAVAGYSFFWDQHGIDFLFKAKLSSTPQSESAGKLSEQVRGELLKTYVAQLKELLGLTKVEEKQKPLIAKIDEDSIKKLWKELISLENNTSRLLEVIREIRQSFDNADKKEPAIVNYLIDETVKKICTNVLEITKYLKEKRQLDDLVQSLKKHYSKEIRGLKKGGYDIKEMQTHERILLGMLSANQLSCPIFVKEKVLEITTPKKGLLSAVKSFFMS